MYSNNNFSLTDIFKLFKESYSAHPPSMLENAQRTWQNLIESMDFFIHWTQEKKNIAHMNTESWVTNNFKESLVVKASSNIETALRDCSIARLRGEFPLFSDLDEFINNSAQRMRKKDKSHEKIQNQWIESIKNYIPYGANPSVRQIKEYLGYISPKCGSDFDSTVKNSNLEATFINHMVAIRNSISHGNDMHVITDEMLAIFIWHSFEVTSILNKYAEGANETDKGPSSLYATKISPFEEEFLNFQKESIFT